MGEDSGVYDDEDKDSEGIQGQTVSLGQRSRPQGQP